MIANKEAVIADQDAVIADKSTVIDELSEQVRLLKAIAFAKKSETAKKPAKDEYQYSLFDEAEFVCELPSSEQEPEVVQVPAHCRAKKGRKHISESIPREEIVHDIPAEEKICACGCELIRIGEVVSEKLDYVPAKIRVLRHIRPKYACKKCEGTEDDGQTVKVAPMPPQLIRQGIVTPGLLAHIMTNKFCDGLLFYRQNKMFERLGIDISRFTMSNWTVLAAQRCGLLMELMYEHLRCGGIINLDETPVQVLKEPGRENTTKSYMWVACRSGTKPVVLFHYAPSRAGKIATEIVGDFKGVLQTDGYAGYNALGGSEGIVHAGCLVHVRRKFMDVLKAGSKKKKGTASTVINLIAKLYRLESRARKDGFSPEEILNMRTEKARPLLNKIYEIILKSAGSIPPTSLLGKALSYALGQWPRITVYLENPALTPDNNIAENAIRPFAVGRKNWLFSGSPRGADASATFYSLIETAKANNLNPSDYLYELFEKLPHAQCRADLEELMPWNLANNAEIK
ncbi:IS66 family transposase [Maridesulfovibrio hydrothermalis]|uniref:Transposase n=3 Tax=Maridesulfovibrio TaxID=2794998 RepID=L0R6D8_9BACT|nr:IS66 family transposase [Maridesulfovibrio hydrothermalis]CCO22268.1 transposase [Maridesulfovibrio hydrothermalis AM13 = DSM 14728]